jgi:hypothetical protein
MREPLPLLERIGRLIGGRLAQLAARPPEAR